MMPVALSSLSGAFHVVLSILSRMCSSTGFVFYLDITTMSSVCERRCSSCPSVIRSICTCQPNCLFLVNLDSYG